MTQSSFMSSPETAILVSTKASQELAQQLVDALKQKSADSYAQLIPSLNDFNNLMKEHSFVYSNHLAEAQKSFAVDYENTLVPAVKNSFDQLLADGIEKGIQWNEVSLLNWETVDHVEEQFAPVPFSIVIEAQGKIFKIEIQKAFYLNGKWKVSQFVKLV
jgi:hypothetical protein